MKRFPCKPSGAPAHQMALGGLARAWAGACCRHRPRQQSPARRGKGFPCLPSGDGGMRRAGGARQSRPPCGGAGMQRRWQPHHRIGAPRSSGRDRLSAAWSLARSWPVRGGDLPAAARHPSHPHVPLPRASGDFPQPRGAWPAPSQGEHRARERGDCPEELPPLCPPNVHGDPAAPNGKGRAPSALPSPPCPRHGAMLAQGK